jgi:hypothetical protein
MPIDTTYSFFSAPDFVTIDTIPAYKTVGKIPSRTSHPELTVLYHGATQSTAMEEWTTDATYGYFSSPTLNLEPVYRERQQILRPVYPITETRKPVAVQDGYSFFGI